MSATIYSPRLKSVTELKFAHRQQRLRFETSDTQEFRLSSCRSVTVKTEALKSLSRTLLFRIGIKQNVTQLEVHATIDHYRHFPQAILDSLIVSQLIREHEIPTS